MYSSSYNHTVSTLVDEHLITDNPISRVGQGGMESAALSLTLAPDNRNQIYSIFPDHTRLPYVVHYGQDPRRTITYGLVQGGSAFGIVLPDVTGEHPFYITVDYEKMVDPTYQVAVRLSIFRVAMTAHLQVSPEGIDAVLSLMRMQPQAAVVGGAI